LIIDDATRVTLDLIDGDPNSHYINASFIKVQVCNHTWNYRYVKTGSSIMIKYMNLKHAEATTDLLMQY
jgi:protein tyrosine phosphatase